LDNETTRSTAVKGIGADSLKGDEMDKKEQFGR
jgi:hypothetical protein